MAHSVLSVGCRSLLLACEALGVDGEQLTERVGLDRSVVDDPDGRVAPEVVFKLWQAAEEASQDPHLALRVARATPVGAYRVLEYLVQSAPTVGAALAKVGQYFAWIDTSVGLPIIELEGYRGCAIRAPAPPSLVPLRAVELTFATCLLKVRAATSGPLVPARVDVAGPRPSDPQQLEEFFGCPLVFGATDNRLLFDQESWDLPLSSGDPSLVTLLEPHAQRLVDSVVQESDFSARVRRVLSESGGQPSVADVARRLAVSPRTLQRRLGEEGVSFATLADGVRAELARSLVAQREVAIIEVAFLLGFADQSSFTRSFKRWTGLTPSAYRSTPR